jgi:hypothetical protein
MQISKQANITIQRHAYTDFYKQLENWYMELKMYTRELRGRRIAPESDYCTYTFYESNLYHFKQVTCLHIYLLLTQIGFLSK